jgi:hypothetical protein
VARHRQQNRIKVASALKILLAQIGSITGGLF